MDITFVVSTGRSGSTMLSKILQLHPEVLSLSEFFIALQRAPFRWEVPSEPLDGARLWELMTGADPISDAMILAGLKNDEMLYHYDSGRFSPATGIPNILHSTLPVLTDKPDWLYGELEQVVPGWPERPAAEQFMHLFGFLASLLGRRVIVERSGTSLALVDELVEQFPGARFVHMYRDGVDCTLSMLRHPLFRFAGLHAILAEEAGLTGDPTVQEIAEVLPEQAKGLILPPFDAEKFMAYDIPPTLYARTWSALVAGGIAALAKLPPTSWTQLGFEHLLADPEGELTKLAAFLDVPPDPGWLVAAASLIDPMRTGASATIDPELLAELRAACRRGEEALASAGATLAPVR
jgi:sulfotransferase family protein